MDVLDWLLASDPAIRFQTLRDLTAAPPETLEAERARVAREGLAAAILARQALDGPFRREGEPDWLPTLFTMQLLRGTGVDPRDPSVVAAVERLNAGFRWDESFGAKPFFGGEVEACINGGVLALGGYFGRAEGALAERLLSEQLADGGWNCEAPPSTRSSFHSTICVLEGLLEYERAAGATPALTAARLRGEAYLLERALFRRLSTAQVADPTFLELAYPPRYHYDVLRALDYFRAAGRPFDPRMDEALTLVAGRMGEDGRWLLERAYDESLDVPFDEAVGAPSRWNTLRALRVLAWFGRPVAGVTTAETRRT